MLVCLITEFNTDSVYMYVGKYLTVTYISKRYWALANVSSKVGDFPNVSLLLKSLFSQSKIVWEILNQLVYKLCFTKYQILLHLLQGKPVLKLYIKFQSIMPRIVAELH